jgi:hypothetical protein
VGYVPGRSDNENLILFRERSCPLVVPSNDPCRTRDSCADDYDCWDHGSMTLAVTTTSFDPGSGRLYDADVEINSAGFPFTANDGPPCTGTPTAGCTAYDVENTLTHEMGHVLGLDHSSEPTSTMYFTAPAGETIKRTLDDGSRAFLCEAYPQNSATNTCSSEARLVAGTSFACTSASGAPLAVPAGLVVLWTRRRNPRAR